MCSLRQQILDVFVVNLEEGKQDLKLAALLCLHEFKETVETKSHHSFLLFLPTEHSVGLACPRHSIDEDRGIIPREYIADGVAHGAFKHLQVSRRLPEYLLILIDPF